jgi:HEAT repeat protein
VVRRALELFAEGARTDFIPLAERLQRHDDPEIRAAALRARTRVRPEEAPLRAALQDPSPLVRATAVTGLVAGGFGDGEAGALLETLVASGTPDVQASVARAIAEQPTPALQETLLRLAESPADEVGVPVAVAMGLLTNRRFLPALLRLLERHEARPAARAAFLAYGGEGLSFLEEALSDRGLPSELRRHLPRAISDFGSPAAAAVLERRLLEERQGAVRFRILRALNRLSARPDITIDAAVLERATEATLGGIFRLLHWRSVLEHGRSQRPSRATAGHELLVQLLRDKEAHAAERLFRLLSLRFRGEDFKGVYRALRSDESRLRASARELLENLLVPPLRSAVLAIIDGGELPGRLAGAGPYYSPVALDYEGVLALILDEGGEALRCMAAHHAGELGLASLAPRLERLRADGVGFFLQRVVERALRTLARRKGEAALA